MGLLIEVMSYYGIPSSGRAASHGRVSLPSLEIAAPKWVRESYIILTLSAAPGKKRVGVYIYMHAYTFFPRRSGQGIEPDVSHPFGGRDL